MSFRYKAFISYAHADKAHARNLHVRLETFSTPKQIVDRDGRWGKISPKLKPIFRDRDELPTGSALGPELRRALDDAEFLLVLCSPAAANSVWVNEEIRYYRSKHGDDHILAAIVGGDPAAPVGPDGDGCFPPALIEPPDGEAAPREPIAADFREGGDGRRLAFLKVAAGMLGVGLDDLARRDAQRRQKFLAGVAAASLAVAFVTLGLAFYANNQRIAANEQRVIAERERDTARTSLDYLVSIFEIANPETENPKTITALSILERGNEKIRTELSDRPDVQATLMGAMGDVYANLGEVDKAEVLLTEAIDLPALRKEDQLEAKLSLANLYFFKGEYDKTTTLANEVETALTQNRVGDFTGIYDVAALSARTKEMQALSAYGAFNYSEAINFYDQARLAFETSENNHAESIARINTNQGMLLVNLAEFERARGLLSAAYEYFASKYGSNHLNSAISLHNWAYAEFTAGENEVAAQKMRDALEIYENVLESKHEKLANGWFLYGRIKYAEGDFPESKRAMHTASNAFAEAFGPDHLMIGTVLIYLSQYQSDNNDVEGAFESLAEARRVYNANFLPDHANHGDLLVYEAIALNAAGRRDEAIEACAKGMAILEKAAADNVGWVEENRTMCAEISGA